MVYHKALGVSVLTGSRERLFLLSEVPLYPCRCTVHPPPFKALGNIYRRNGETRRICSAGPSRIQGYLAHKKQRPPAVDICLGPYGGSRGIGVFL